MRASTVSEHHLEGLPAGAQEVAFSDVLLVASHALRSDGKDFLMTGSAPMAAQAMIRNLGDKGWIELGANTFRNDTLDTLLDQALASSGETEAAVAAMCTGFLHVFEVEDAPATSLHSFSKRHSPSLRLQHLASSCAPPK
jgi:hypothetical protein